MKNHSGMKEILGLAFLVFVCFLFCVATMLTCSGCAKKNLVKPEPEIITIIKPETTIVTDTVREVIEKPAEINYDGLPIIYFDHDKYYIRPDQLDKLNAMGNALNISKVKFIIEGHCDESGTNEYNMSLGEFRATKIFDYLEDIGIPEGRMKTISYGEERPVEPNTGINEKNRRVVIAPDNGGGLR